MTTRRLPGFARPVRTAAAAAAHDDEPDASV
jgi:hypothetical protein